MNIPYYFLNDSLQGEAASIFVFIGGAVVVILLAVGLWTFPLTIAGKLLPSDVKEPIKIDQPDLWLAMGCALMGLWFVASTTSSFLQDLILARSELAPAYSDRPSIWLGLYLPRTIIGAWLIVGGRGFRRLFWWARVAGHGTAPRKAPDTSTE